MHRDVRTVLVRGQQCPSVASTPNAIDRAARLVGGGLADFPGRAAARLPEVASSEGPARRQRRLDLNLQLEHARVGCPNALGGRTYFSAGLKSRNTMSGALVLWREGTVRPAQSSAAVARLKSITGVCVQRSLSLARQPTCATSALPSRHEHRTQRRERPLAPRRGCDRFTSSTMRSWSSLSSAQGRAAAAHEIQA